MEAKHKYLSAALYAIGVIFVAGVPVMMLLSDRWSWTPPQYEYEQWISVT